MTQPDSLNVQNSTDLAQSLELNAELEASQAREWFPEDEDEWYEPDYSRKADRAS